MKLPTLILLLLLSALIVYAWMKGPEVFSMAWENSLGQLVQYAPLIVIALLIAGFTETLIPASFVENWLSDSAGFKGILAGWFGGIVTPIAGVFSMPLIATLYKTGASLPVIMTYITSLATLSMVKVPIEVGIYGWKLTLMRIGVSIILPIVAGFTTWAFMRLLSSA